VLDSNFSFFLRNQRKALKKKNYGIISPKNFLIRIWKKTVKVRTITFMTKVGTRCLKREYNHLFCFIIIIGKSSLLYNYCRDALYRKFERGANGWLGKIHVTALEDKEEPHVDIELGKNGSPFCSILVLYYLSVGIEFSFTKNELDDLKSYACFKYDQELQASAELTKKRAVVSFIESYFTLLLQGASTALDDDDFLELGINSGALLSQLKASEASEASDAEAESDSAHREADKMLRRRLSHSGIKNVALVKQVHAPSKPATPLAVAARAAVQVGAKKVTTPPSGTCRNAHLVAVQVIWFFIFGLE